MIPLDDDEVNPILWSPSPSPAPSVESAAASSVLPSKKRKMALPKPRLRISYNAEMNKAIMNQFLTYTREGLFNSTKSKDYAPVWSQMVPWAKERWPQYPWTARALSDKYMNEKKRFRVWKSLVDESGVSIDPVTNLPQAPDDKWEAFVRRFTTNTLSVDWVRTTELGDIDVYTEVFWRERATGLGICEVGDELDEPESESNDERAVGRGRTTKRPALFDPDEVSRRTAFPTVRVESSTSTTTSAAASRAGSRRRRDKGDDDTNLVIGLGLLGQALCASATTVAAAPKPLGAEYIEGACSDFRTGFSEGLTTVQRAIVFEKLADPSTALLWTQLDKEVKRFKISQWIG